MYHMKIIKKGQIIDFKVPLLLMLRNDAPSLTEKQIHSKKQKYKRWFGVRTTIIVIH